MESGTTINRGNENLFDDASFFPFPRFLAADPFLGVGKTAAAQPLFLRITLPSAARFFNFLKAAELPRDRQEISSAQRK